ncbi:MAG: hypothetical protein J5I93_25750, partial [Pirellulaceae bacterium]|nr:hypothetical protein [Pirellulaceae bacterium]
GSAPPVQTPAPPPVGHFGSAVGRGFAGSPASGQPMMVPTASASSGTAARQRTRPGAKPRAGHKQMLILAGAAAALLLLTGAGVGYVLGRRPTSPARVVASLPRPAHRQTVAADHSDLEGPIETTLPTGGSNRPERSEPTRRPNSSLSGDDHEVPLNSPPPVPSPPSTAVPPPATSAAGDRPPSPDDSNAPPPAATPPAGIPPTAAPSAAASPAVTQSSSSESPTPQPPAAAEKRTVLYQEVEIQRRPTYSVQGVTIPQHVHYRILSRLEIEPPGADGQRTVIQYIEDARLEQADELSRATFTQSLERLKHQQYSFKLNSRGEVIDFQGFARNLAALPVQLPAAQGFQLTSVIDQDGWKELAELSCFQPVDLDSASQMVRRAMHHDWEPLGKWYGTTTFRGQGRAGPLDRITYVHEMEYVPPQQQQNAPGPLPLRINTAQFKTNVASGTILYDPRLRRVTEVQEQFDVAGQVATELLGQAAMIELREQQVLAIRLTDRRPAWQP